MTNKYNADLIVAIKSIIKSHMSQLNVQPKINVLKEKILTDFEILDLATTKILSSKFLD